MNPETILWSRVLLQAIWDLSGIKLNLPKKETPTLQRITRAWFSSFNDSPGSFIWICHVLSLDPEAVRQRVLAKSNAELGAVITKLSPACDAGSILEKSCTEEMQEMYSQAV
jgi:hypothetical protein